MSALAFEALSVVVVSIIVSLLIEALSWFFIYRKSDYKRLTREIKKMNEDLNLLQSKKVSPSEQKKHDKTVQKMKDDLKNKNQHLSSKNMGSNVIITVANFMFFGVVTSLYDGIRVAKLPFTPFGLFSGMTHKNLLGKDFTDCSMNGLYFICNMGIRPVIKALFGHSAPRSQQSMFPSMDEVEEKMKNE
ncbi:hypothetical protein WA158_004353 [Blastocystis sp. Blastoise]